MFYVLQISSCLYFIFAITEALFFLMQLNQLALFFRALHLGVFLPHPKAMEKSML